MGLKNPFFRVLRQPPACLRRGLFLFFPLVLALAVAAAPGAWSRDGGSLLSGLSGDLSFELGPLRIPFSGHWEGGIVPGNGTAPTYVLRLPQWKVDAPGIAGTLSLSLAYTTEQDGLSSTRFEVNGTSMDVALFGVRMQNATIALGGAYLQDPLNGDWRLEDIVFSMREIVACTGHVSQTARDGLEVAVKGRVLDMARFQEAVAALLPESIKFLQGRGELPFTLEYVSRTDPAMQDNRFEITAAPEQFALVYGRDGESKGWDAGEISGQARFFLPLAQGSDGEWEANGTLRLSSLSGEFAQAFPSLRVLSTELSLASMENGIDIRKLVLAPGGKNGVLLTGKVDTASDDALIVSSLEMSGDSFGTINGNATIPLDGQGVDYAGEFVGRDLKIAGVLSLLDRLVGSPTSGWKLSGNAELRAALAGNATAPALEASLEGAGLSFASQDSEYMGEKVRLACGFSGLFTETPKLAADISLDQGEVLLGALYLNLGQTPLALDMEAISSGKGRYDNLVVNADLTEHGQVQARGGLRRDWGGWSFNGKVTIRDAKLASVFETFVSGPLSVSNPELADISVEGAGALDMSVQGGADDLVLGGTLTLSGVNLTDTGSHGLLIRGLDVDLPFGYRFGTDPQSPDAPGKWGSFKAQSISFPVGELQNVDLPVALEPNRFFLGKGIAFPVLGGSLDISEMVVSNPLSGDYLAKFSAQLAGADLNRVNAGPIPLQGELNGRFDNVRLSDEELAFDGSLWGTFFEGELTVANLHVSKPLDPGRIIQADVYIKKMNLEPASQATDIGLITGLLDIAIDDIVVAYGQPVGFKMQAVTVEGDVDQIISLKAVNSISVMGTGSGITDVGVGVFSSFMETFDYWAIGISCELRNDLFQVRGLIKEDGVEYLIKKPLLFGINVVNGNPDNKISFRDMVKRIQRVLPSE